MSFSRKEILNLIAEEDVHFMSLQFTDIDGIAKNVEIPESQFSKAL
ncbi:MAG: type I glutamate--ammonia ligase, partial [Acidobacteria bacterium]